MKAQPIATIRAEGGAVLARVPLANGEAKRAFYSMADAFCWTVENLPLEDQPINGYRF